MNTSTPRDRLWRKRLKELSAVWPDFVSGHTGGLHRTRVASRRIREALPIVAANAPPAKVKKLGRKMRALTRSLGPIRELDVELDILDDRSKVDGVPVRAIEMVRRDVAARRRELRAELADSGPVRDVKKLLRKLERVAEKGAHGKGHSAKDAKRSRAQRHKSVSDDAAWKGVLAARLMRRAKGTAEALDSAGAVYAPERLHDVRISTKKLRYVLEIARDAGVPAALPLITILRHHQARLGQLHDLQMLLKHVREAEASPAVGSRVNDLRAYADSLDRECRRLHAGFIEHRTELESIVKAVRHQVVPALTTSVRRQARVVGTRRPAANTHPRRAKS
jgi:CHAD domain-containing protein